MCTDDMIRDINDEQWSHLVRVVTDVDRRVVSKTLAAVGIKGNTSGKLR